MKEDKGQVEVWGSGSASREFLYAADCDEAIVKAIETDIGPEPINIGIGTETTIKELVEEIAEQMGYEGDIVWQTDKPDGQPRRCLDVTRAKEVLNFEAKTDLKTGIKNTIEWFLKEQQK